MCHSLTIYHLLRVITCTDVKFVLILLFLSYMYICLNVSPSPTYMRSETLVIHLEIDIIYILTLSVLCACLGTYILSHVDLNYRFIPYNTRLNTLTGSSQKQRHDIVYFFLFLMVYFLIFDFFFVIFLPSEYFKTELHIRRITKKINFLVKLLHRIISYSALHACVHLGYAGLASIYQFPFETLAVWIFLMRLALCPDIHPNPGPSYSNHFTGGFLSFCNWNLNTLSKDDFSRITLLEAHNTEHNYDIISLCETCLDDKAQVPET